MSSKPEIKQFSLIMGQMLFSKESAEESICRRICELPANIIIDTYRHTSCVYMSIYLVIYVDTLVFHLFSPIHVCLGK